MATVSRALLRLLSRSTPIIQRTTPTLLLHAAPSLLPSSSSSFFPRNRTPTRRSYATSTTPTSTTQDPQEVAAQEHLEMGNQALLEEDLDAAKRAYGESIRIKDSAIANYNLGVVHYQQQNTNQAISTFLHSLTLSPSPPPAVTSPDSPTPLTPAQILTTDTHTNLGSLYILSKPPRPDLALYHLQEALGIMPEDGEICFNLGAVLEASGEVEEALVAYQRAKNLGIERADVNIRNIGAKILGKRLKEEEEEARIGGGKAKEGEGKDEGEGGEGKGKGSLKVL